MVEPHGLSMRLCCRANQAHLLILAVQTIAARRGKKRAIIAVAHNLIVIGYHLHKNRSNYDDLGRDYFDCIHFDGLKRYLVKRLQQLGHKATLEWMQAV
jgi:transposase